MSFYRVLARPASGCRLLRLLISGVNNSILQAARRGPTPWIHATSREWTVLVATSFRSEENEILLVKGKLEKAAEKEKEKKDNEERNESIFFSFNGRQSRPLRRATLLAPGAADRKLYSFVDGFHSLVDRFHSLVSQISHALYRERHVFAYSEPPRLKSPMLGHDSDESLRPYDHVRILKSRSHLECLRDKERGVIASLRLVLVPIRQLPAELLREIFMLSVEHQAKLDDIAEHQGDFRSEPGVCALEMCSPQYAAVVDIVPAISAIETSLDTTSAGTKLWLERSTPLPLEIDIYSSLETRVIAPLMDTVLIGTLKELDTLSLHCTATGSYTIVTPFLSAPRLRSVELGVPHVRCILLPWAQLIHVTLTFALAPHMALDEFSVGPPTATDIITLAHFRDLELNSSAEDGDSLYISGSKRIEGGVWPDAAAREFQLRCPNIEDIHITFCTITSEGLKTLLVHAPQLVRLHLECCWECVDDIFFNALWYSEADSVHLSPKLDDLFLQAAGTNFGEASLKAMIASRWWTDAELLAMPSPPAVTRWKSVKYWGGDGEEFDEEFVAKISAQGLDLSLTL
ncbi:hypothetical protein C8J57DRAFT_1703647 [Mycena rebaudengoi]|nr:hypothetical protein C8J57DRAFT_1703647 [Mycena rebaudengoi]